MDIDEMRELFERAGRARDHYFQRSNTLMMVLVDVLEAVKGADCFRLAKACMSAQQALDNIEANCD